MVRSCMGRPRVRFPKSFSRAKARNCLPCPSGREHVANSDRTEQGRGLVAIDGAMALIAILLIVQIWLLTATLEAYLAGHASAVLPGAIFSGLIFAACLTLSLFIDRLDRDSRKG